MASALLAFLHRLLATTPDFLFNWQTLIGSITASASAIIAAVIAWKAIMMQIAANQSERDKRTEYATAVANSYLLGVREVVAAIKVEEGHLSAVTEAQWRSDTRSAPMILAVAEAAFTEPNPRTRMGDVESYREELPLFLSNDLRLVFRLENDLAKTISELLGQRNVACTFPIQECQNQLHGAIDKLERALEVAERSSERFRYE